MAVRSWLTGAVVVAASFGLAQGALASGGATVTSTTPTSYQSYATPAGQTLVVNFDSGVSGTTVTQGGVTGTNVYVGSGTVTNQYDAPAGDTSKFAYVSANPANGSATFSFTNPIGSLSLLWGSIDTFNTITFFNGSTAAGVVNGTEAFGGTVPNGTQTSLVNISFTGPVTSAVFSSTQNSFEFDNLAVTAAPEPGTWTLMLGGVGFLGFALRNLRRREGMGVAA